MLPKFREELSYKIKMTLQQKKSWQCCQTAAEKFQLFLKTKHTYNQSEIGMT